MSREYQLGCGQCAEPLTDCDGVCKFCGYRSNVSEMLLTGKTRKRQFVSYPRPWNPRPIAPWPFG